ncbi:hypothetical protein DTO217A2_6818 [Paecilomyces variotii]|nr:hypothetical protein DTO217A2_6818 [Paecilomyces variotii]
MTPSSPPRPRGAAGSLPAAKHPQFRTRLLSASSSRSERPPLHTPYHLLIRTLDKMVVTKYILPALAAASTAFAVSDACDGSSDPITIQNQGDASALSSCSTVKGDIVIAEHTTGGISLDGVEQITGSLSANGAANLTSLSAPELTSIGDTFKLEGLIILTDLSFGSLTSVGSIDWAALPNLQALSFTKGVSKAGSVSITNTGLTSLNGITLDSVGNFDITANTAMDTINVNDLKNVTGLLNIAANAPSLKVTLPNLGGAQNITIRNASSLSIPSLKELSGQLGLFGNTFKEFSAANLTSTGDLVFDNNGKLSNLSMPQLTTVNGGFTISKNDDLEDITGFQKLQTITGALDFTGEFNKVDLPALKQVKGGFNMQSTGNFSCSDFQDIKSTVRGSFTCKSSTPDPTTSDGSSGTSSGTSSSSSSSSTAKSAASLVDINAPAVALIAAFGAMLQALL